MNLQNLTLAGSIVLCLMSIVYSHAAFPLSQISYLKSQISHLKSQISYPFKGKALELFIPQAIHNIRIRGSKSLPSDGRPSYDNG